MFQIMTQTKFMGSMIFMEAIIVQNMYIYKNIISIGNKPQELKQLLQITSVRFL